MVSNVSFNEEYWSKQPLSDFITEAAKYKWSKHDAIVYHKKIQAQFGIAETDKDKVIELTEQITEITPKITEITEQITESHDNTGNEVIAESVTE